VKDSIVDAEIAIRNRVFEVMLTEAFSFNRDTFEDASQHGLGDLIQQNQEFWVFQTILEDSYRVGPSLGAPTRYEGTLEVALYTKNPSAIADQRKMEWVTDKFSEQTLSGVRFRTFFPYKANMERGFTAYKGVIHFDFELYRGNRYGY
jgi:hypothetical protein